MNLNKELESFIKNNGGWSAHNIKLEGDLYTIDNRIINDEYKVKRVIQNIKDTCKKDFNQLRILDLACLEGLFGIECALHGANVVFLDAREANLEKVKFVADNLNIKNYELVVDDVRDISIEKYGEFDVILCFGIFYHLDKNDLYPFVNKMYEMTKSIVFFDTHITHKKNTKFTENGVDYFGFSYKEHRSDISEQEMKEDLWKSFKNQYSFIMSKSSLIRMLDNIGFSSVFESHLPTDRTKNPTRISLIAIKNESLNVLCAPNVNNKKSDIDEFSLGKVIRTYLMVSYNNFIYEFKLNMPRSVRLFYKKYIKRNNNYKNR